MPGHVPADLGEIGLAGASFMNELPVKHYDQVVGQFQQFVETLADQQHCGAAVLLVSEDLDELLELSDRLVVMFHGQFVHEARASEANLTEIGRHMAGH